jgi:hypothetical protein
MLWNIRELGVTGACRKFITSTYDGIFHRSENLYYMDLSGDASLDAPTQNGVEIMNFKSANDIPKQLRASLGEFVTRNGMGNEFTEYYLEKILHLFKEGATMHVALQEEKAVAYLWSMTHEGNHSPTFRSSRWLPGRAYFWRYYVTLLSRQGVPADADSPRGGLREGNGGKRVYATCRTWNTASARCITKAGMNRISTGRCISVFGRRIVFWSRVGND